MLSRGVRFALREVRKQNPKKRRPVSTSKPRRPRGDRWAATSVASSKAIAKRRPATSLSEELLLRQSLAPSVRAQRLVVEKPCGWEYLLLGQVLHDEFRYAARLRQTGTGSAQRTDAELVSDVGNYLAPHLSDLGRAIPLLSSLFERSIPTASWNTRRSGRFRRASLRCARACIGASLFPQVAHRP